ncbi:uncharacterized protein PITG_15857 [Phytophthora infestans T30-4]|uniref:Uncharacterized protein n=1 Tax=Phytophthora infestans (strain T30-4) TaxID=403677 RepID=D0NRW6_PHYIT|nr:uncharacterized protein PITG_15857 [Phytophthora infestans T30-4]EEY63507.1 conserved hypothetical protein [Phytophthora infestans T30-4]|eukprot:XP_002898094.1 conserved hypothetical protein [Phytophthora infestans T30-4]
MGLLRPQELLVGRRFAMWLLGPWALGPGHNVSDLLLMDQQMARQLGTTLRPAGRLLLPLAAAPGPDQLASLRLWVDGDNVEASWTNALQRQQLGDFVALTVFKQPDVPGRAVRVSNVSGNVGSRVLLSNQYVKLWDFHVPSRTSCELHEHLHPYMFLNRTACETQGLGAELQPSGPVTSFAACEFRCVEVNDTERHVHAFLNPGGNDVQQYIVEFVV